MWQDQINRQIGVVPMPSNDNFIYNEESLKRDGRPGSGKDPVGPTYETPGKITGGILQSNRSEELHNKLLAEIHETYLKKNADYGNSFEESLDKHGALAAVIQMEHKLNRLNNLISNETNQRVVDESIVDTVMDLANYAVMTGVWLVKQREGEAKFYADNQEYKMSGADFDGDVVSGYGKDTDGDRRFDAWSRGRRELEKLELDMLNGLVSPETYRFERNKLNRLHL